MASLHSSSPLPSYWLHHAVAKGDLKLIKELLLDTQFPANKKVECPNGTFYYPLHVALYLHNTTAAKLLIDAGATPESVLNDFRKKYGLPLLPQELDEATNKQQIISNVCDSGNSSTDKKPSSDSSADNEQDKTRGDGGISSFCSVAATDGSEADAGGAAVDCSGGVQACSNSGDNSKQDAPAVAVAAGRNSSAVAPDNPSDESDCGSMTSSSSCGCGSITEECKPAGADAAALSLGVEMPYSQWYSRQCNFIECLLEWKADVSGVADHHLGTSWLHETVRHKLKRDLTKKLVDAGTPLDAGDGKGNTALHFSLEIDDLQMSKALLQQGANMNLYNKIGFTSFGCACMNGEASTVDYMITLGADVNGGSRQPLFLTCKAYLAKMMYRHCETGSVVMQDQQTAWRSQWAADKNLRAVYVSIAKNLLSHGADPHARDDEGNFPLLAAAESGFHEVIPDLAAADTYRAALAAIAAIEEHAKANSGSVSAEARSAASAARAAAAAGDAAAKARALQKVPAAELAKAAEKAGIEVTTLLTDVAPSANRCNNTEAVTPMMMAVSWGYSSTVEALVKAGADPNQAAGVPKEKKQPIFIAAKLGHLDVVNKLVELGADWPHGRPAAIVGNDVVQMLIKNYKGPKKLQPSVVVKLLSAAEKRGQQARAKQSTTSDSNSESDLKPPPDPAATAVSGSSSSKAHEAMMQLLLLEEQEKQQQQKAGSSDASKKNKKKKDKKKKKLASVTHGPEGGEEGSEAEQEADLAAAAAANDSLLGTASAAAAAEDFAALGLNDSTSSAAASTGATAAPGADARNTRASAKAPDGVAAAVEQQQQIQDLRLHLEKLGLKVPEGEAFDQLRSILTATWHKEDQQQQQQNGAVHGSDYVAEDTAELAATGSAAAATAASERSDSKKTNNMFVFGSEQGESVAGVDTVGSSHPLAQAIRDNAVDADTVGDLAAAVAAAALLPLPQEPQAAEGGDGPKHAAVRRVLAAKQRQDVDLTHGNKHSSSSSSSSGTATGTSRVPKRKVTTGAGAPAAIDPSSSSSKSAAGLMEDAKLLQAKQGPAAVKSAAASSSSSMDGSSKKDQSQVPQNQPDKQGGKQGQVITEASEAARRAMVAISGRSTAGHSSAAGGGGGGGGSKVVKQEASVGSAGPDCLVAAQSSSKQKRQSDSSASSQGGSVPAAIASGVKAAKQDPTVGSGSSAAVQSSSSSSHSSKQQRQSDSGNSSHAGSGAVEHAADERSSLGDWPDKRAVDLGQSSTNPAGHDFTEVLSRHDKEASRRSEKLVATAAAAAAAALTGSSKAAVPKPSGIGVSRSSSSSGSGMGGSSLQQAAAGVRLEDGGSNIAVDPWATPYQSTHALHLQVSAAGAHSSNSSATLNPAAAAFQPNARYPAATAAAPCPDTSSSMLPPSSTAAAHHGYQAAARFPTRSNSEPIHVTEPNPGAAAAAVAGLSADGTLPASTTAAAAATNRVSRLLPPHLRFGLSGAGSSTAAASATSSSIASSPVVVLQQQQPPWAGAGESRASGAAQQQQQQQPGAAQQQQPWAGTDQVMVSGAAQQHLQQQQRWAGADEPMASAAVQQQYAALSQGPASSGGSAQAPQQQQWLQPQQLQVTAQGAAIGSSAHQYIQPWQQQQQRQVAYSQAAPPAYPSVATQPATSTSMAAPDSSAAAVAATAMPAQQWQQAYAAAPVQQLQPGAQYNTAPPQQHWQLRGPPLSQQQQYTSYPSYTTTASLMQPDAAAGQASASSNSGSNLIPATHISSGVGMPPPAAAAGPLSSWCLEPSTGSVRYVQQEWPPQQQPLQQPLQQQPWQRQLKRVAAVRTTPQQWQQHVQGVTLSHPQQLYAAPPPQQQPCPHPVTTARPTTDNNRTYGPPPPATTNAAVGHGFSGAAGPPTGYQPPLTAAAGANSVGPGPASTGPGSSNSESMGAAALLELQRLQEKYENMTCCVVCLDHPRSVLLLPCKHLALCAECSGNLQAGGGGGECPVCRVPIVQHISGCT